MASVDNKLRRATLSPKVATAARVAVRGPSGKLYGYLDPQTLTLEVKKSGQAVEQIDLKPLLNK